MKTTKNIIILLFCIFLNKAFSQSIEYYNGEEFDISKEYSCFATLKYDETRYIKFDLNEDDEKDMRIQFFDQNLENVISEKTFEMPECAKNKHPLDIINIKNNIYYFYMYYDRLSKKEYIKALLFNKTANNFNDTPIDLSESEKMLQCYSLNHNKIFITIDARITFSNDSSTFLIAYLTRFKNKKENEKVTYNLFSQNLKKVYSAEIEIPYHRKYIYHYDFLNDNKGNIYSLFTIKNENASKVKIDNRIEYKYELFLINKTENSLNKVEFNKQNKNLDDPIFKENENGQITLTGFYSDTFDKLFFSGIFQAKIDKQFDKNGFTVIETYTELPDNIKNFNAINKEKPVKRDSKQNNNYLGNEILRPVKIVFTNEGNYTIFAEKQFYKTYPGNEHSIEEYFRNDIVVLNLNKEGKLIWNKTINKIQTNENNIVRQTNLSFNHYVINNLNYIFYVDDIENKTKAFDETPKQFINRYHNINAYLNCLIIDNSGKIIKKSVLDITLKNENFEIGNLKKIEKDILINRMDRGRTKFRYVKIEIKK